MKKSQNKKVNVLRKLSYRNIHHICTKFQWKQYRFSYKNIYFLLKNACLEIMIRDFVPMLSQFLYLQQTFRYSFFIPYLNIHLINIISCTQFCLNTHIDIALYFRKLRSTYQRLFSDSTVSVIINTVHQQLYRILQQNFI